MAEATDAENNNAAREEDQRRRREEEMERLLLEQEQLAEQQAAAEHEPPQQQQDHADGDAEAQPQRNNEGEPLLIPPTLPPPPKTTLLSYRPASLLAFLGMIYYALRTRRQYYLAAVYLSSSKWAYAVAGNAALAAALSVFDGVISFFLKGLRPHEAEGLQDFFRWNVTETCLALTMFRHELTVTTALRFVALITVKCWHHVASQREQHWRLTEEAVTGTFPYIRHWSLLSFLIFLQLLDLITLQYTVQTLVETGPTVAILFAFEAAIMLISAWSHILLWHLHVVDSLINFGHDREWKVACRLLHPWKECKATLTFAVELQAQAMQFLFYATFFSIVMTYYGMPINLFREVYMSLARLTERLTAFLKYRQLMASMNRFQNATEEELDEAGRTCIICRDDMTVHDCKRLPVCSHFFHKSCLREWLVQQQSCPTCRSDISAMEAQERARNAAADAADQRGAGATENAGAENVAPEQQQPIPAAAPTTATDLGGAPPSTEPTLPQRAQHQQSPFVDMLQTNESHSKYLNRYKTIRFRRNIMKPTLYRVTHPDGATVYARTPRGGWPAPQLGILRIVETGKLVLCQDRQSYLFSGDTDLTILLQVPDGWVREDSLEIVAAID